MKTKNKSTILIILLGLGVLCVAVAAFFGFSYLSQKNGKENGEEISVVVEMGTTPTQIATQLEQEGVVKSAFMFRVYLKLNGLGADFHYGTFTLRENMGFDEIAQALQQHNTDRPTATVTFPEGYTLIQMAQAMEAAGLCDQQAFIDAAVQGDYSTYRFFDQVVESDVKFLKTEGYLFPDTYAFFLDEPVESMVGKIFANFDKKITDDLYQRMEELGMTLEETLTLASIIQEEAGDPANMYDVSAVLHNRLAPGSPQPKLECDVARRYIRVYMEPYFGGSANVSEAMHEAYDLYDCIGLCAGPICNPGLDAIDAALHPERSQYYENGYYFFVTDEAGTYYYAKTFDGHVANINQAESVNASLRK